MSTAAEARPVVALDFDGVLNPLGFEVPQGFVEHTVHAPVGVVPESAFIRGGGRTPLTTTVRINTDHGAWIESLLEVADVVWATTWEEAANVCIAPLLGIDPLPVGISVEDHPPRFGHMRNGDSAAWKAEALENKFAGRPLVWADDTASAWIRQAEEVHQTRHLFWTDNEYYLDCARRFEWDNRGSYAPSAHFEDTWAESGRLIRSAWSSIGYGGAFRFPDPRDPEREEVDESDLLDWGSLIGRQDNGADPAPTMTVHTVPEIGLTPAQMDAITRFVHEHASR